MSHRAQEKAEARAAREAAEAQAVQAERRRRLMIFGGVVGVAAVALVAVILIAGSGGDSPKPPKGGAPSGVALFAGIPQEGEFLGAPAAPVVVEEYGDLQCPFCAEFAKTNLPPIVKDFVRSGEVRMRLRLVSILGPDSAKAAKVGAAAMLQNKGWDFAETFYRNQKPENSGYVDDEFMREQAVQAGVDADKAFAQRDSAQVQKMLQANTAAFDQNGLDGTPSFRVGPANGQMKVVSDPAKLPAAIQAAVDQSKKTPQP